MAAEGGDYHAQYNLALLLEKGKCIKQDLKRALYWYEKAASSGLVEAQFNLGYMHHMGIGTKQRFSEAMKWYLSAADNGDNDAKFNLEQIRIFLKEKAHRT